MKISNRTLSILKNFSTINNSIHIKKGNVFNTTSKESNVIAEAKVEESFPVDFAIYDLNGFLGAISLFKDPSFEFKNKTVVIRDENRSISYVYCEPEMISVIVPKIKLPEITFSFDIQHEDLHSLMKASSIMCLPDFLIIGNGETLNAIVTDVKNPSSNNYSIVLNPDCDMSKLEEFKYVFKCENLKLVPGNYTVNIRCLDKETAVGQFVNDSNLSYYIIVEEVL